MKTINLLIRLDEINKQTNKNKNIFLTLAVFMCFFILILNIISDYFVKHANITKR